MVHLSRSITGSVRLRFCAGRTKEYNRKGQAGVSTSICGCELELLFHDTNPSCKTNAILNSSLATNADVHIAQHQYGAYMLP